MLPVFHNVQSERFTGTGSNIPGFQLFPINVVSYLAAGTTFFLAMIILSRRIVGGLAFHPPIFTLLLVAIIGGGLIATANQPWLRWNTTLHRLATLTRCNVFATVFFLGIWPPILTVANLVTAVLLGAIVTMPSRHTKHQEPGNISPNSYWPFIEDLRKIIYEYTSNLLQPHDTHPKTLHDDQRRTPLWRRVFLQKNSDNPQQAAPLEKLLNAQRIRPINTQTYPDDAGILLQWQERYEMPDGTEHLRGQMIVNLSAGTRLATGHIGFCPSFSSMPTVDVTTEYDALEVSVTAAETLPWGVRIECRVEEAIDEPTSVPVTITVKNSPESPNP